MARALIAVSFLLLIVAMNVYLDRFDRLLEHHTIFEGITYTDAHVMLTGLLVVCAALVLGAAIAMVNAVRSRAERAGCRSAAGGGLLCAAGGGGLVC